MVVAAVRTTFVSAMLYVRPEMITVFWPGFSVPEVVPPRLPDPVFLVKVMVVIEPTLEATL